MELLHTKDYGYLGIVSWICKEIGLVSLIDSLTASDEQRKVSIGLALKQCPKKPKQIKNYET